MEVDLIFVKTDINVFFFIKHYDYVGTVRS
jgi:hypothetical protein